MEWFESISDLIEFGRVLVAIDSTPTCNDLLYYFEKPEKWIPEHDVWITQGCPTTEDSVAWGAFVTAVEKLPS
jgi:hypothetical protein